MTVNPRESFKLKLCLSILGTSLAAFLLIFGGVFYYTTKEIRDSVSGLVTSKLALAKKGLDDKIESLETASRNLIGIVKSPAYKYGGTNAEIVGKTYLKSNPEVLGVTVGFEDGASIGRPGPWCLYVMRKGDDFVVRNLAEVYDYKSADWYKIPISTHKEGFTEPFRESNGSLIVSYTTPLYDEVTGAPERVVAVNQSLNDLSDMLQKLIPYEGSEIYLVDKRGRYIAHPDHSLVLQPVSNQEIVDFIRSDDKYYVDKSQGREVYLFRSIVEKTGWTIVLSVPRHAMVSRPTRMMNFIVISIVLGILLLLAMSWFVINRLTKPLETFAVAAREISHGNFDIDLPVITTHNELYDLRSALASMKVSLDSYISQLEETSSKKASIEKELDIARKIQMNMIPKGFHPDQERDTLDIAASLTPAQAVGGDLFDYVLHGDKFFFCIGDVSGKGVPAAMLMAITRSLFRNVASENVSPAHIASVINDSISQDNEMSMFVTMIIASFDVVTGELRVCNCGHNRPVTNGHIVDVKSMKTVPDAPYHLINGVPVNVAVGIVPGFEYREVVLNITPGCMLLLYTDGITEAENEKGELYEEERLLSCLRGMPDSVGSKEIVDTLVADVKSFSGDAVQSDDITVLCLRCRQLV